MISALLGLFFAPSNAGKTLEELHPEERRGERDEDEPRFSRAGADAAKPRERVASG